MGDAVVDVVTEVVVAVVVSTVATKIAEKIGLSDSMANLVGIGAAGYVAHARAQDEPHPIFGGGTGEAEPPAAGMDLNSGIQGAEADQAGTNAPIAPSDNAPSGPAPNAVAGLTDPGGQGPAGTLPAGGAAPGMLTQGQTPATAPAPAPVPTTDVPQVQSKLVEPPPKEDDSYWSKLFTPGRTMDMLLAGIGGAAKDKQAQEDREYPEKVAQANAAGWVNADPNPSGVGKVRQSFPGQGYLSQYQQ